MRRLLETQREQVLDDEAEHDRRAADEGDGIVHRHVHAGFLEQAADDADIAVPTVAARSTVRWHSMPADFSHSRKSGRYINSPGVLAP